MKITKQYLKQLITEELDEAGLTVGHPGVDVNADNGNINMTQSSGPMGQANNVFHSISDAFKVVNQARETTQDKEEKKFLLNVTYELSRVLDKMKEHYPELAQVPAVRLKR